MCVRECACVKLNVNRERLAPIKLYTILIEHGQIDYCYSRLHLVYFERTHFPPTTASFAYSYSRVRARV